MSSLTAALKPTLFAETLLKKFEETLLDQNVSKKVKEEVEKISSKASELFEFIRKVQKLIVSLLAKLLPEKFMNPLNRLFKMIRNIPLDKLKKFLKQSVVVVEKLFQSVKDGDLYPTPKCTGCISICQSYGPLGRQEESESNLFEFINQFKDLSDGVFSLLPMDFIDRVLNVDFKTDNQIIEKLNEHIAKAQNTLEKSGEFIKGAADKVNPLLLLQSFQKKLERRNSDIFIPEESEESIEDILQNLENQKDMDEKELGEKEKAIGFKFFDKLKKHSEETMKFVEEVVENLKSDTLSFLRELDFLQLEKLLNMIRDFINNFSVQKFLGYVKNVADTVEFLKSYKDVLLQMVKSPGNMELFQKIFGCFFNQPEFMKEAFVLFQDLMSIVDLNEVISIFEEFIDMFTTVDLFKSTELVDSIKNDSDALKDAFEKSYEKFKEVSEKVMTTVKDFILPFYFVGKDQLEKTFKLPPLDFNFKLPIGVFDLNFDPKDFAKKQLMLIDSSFSTMTNLGGKTFDGMIDLGGKTFDSSSKLAKGAIKGVSDVGTKTFDSTGKLASGTVKGVGKGVSDTTAFVSGAGSKTVDGISNVGKGIGKGMTDTSSKVTGGMKNVTSGVTNTGGKVIGSVGNVFKQKSKENVTADVKFDSEMTTKDSPMNEEIKEVPENKIKQSTSDSIVNSNLNVLGIGKKKEEKKNDAEKLQEEKQKSGSLLNSNINVLGIGKKSEKKESNEEIKSPKSGKNINLNPFAKKKEKDEPQESPEEFNQQQEVELPIETESIKLKENDVESPNIEKNKVEVSDDHNNVKSPKSGLHLNLNPFGIGKKHDKSEPEHQESDKNEVKSPKNHHHLNILGIGKKHEKKEMEETEVKSPRKHESQEKNNIEVTESNESQEVKSPRSSKHLNLNPFAKKEKRQSIEKETHDEPQVKSPRKKTGSILNSNLNVLGIGKKHEKKEDIEEHETHDEPQVKSPRKHINLNPFAKKRHSTEKETSDGNEEVEVKSPRKKTGSILNSNLNVLGIGKKKDHEEKTDDSTIEESNKKKSKRNSGFGLGKIGKRSSKELEKVSVEESNDESEKSEGTNQKRKSLNLGGIFTTSSKKKIENESLIDESEPKENKRKSTEKKGGILSGFNKRNSAEKKDDDLGDKKSPGRSGNQMLNKFGLNKKK